MSYERSRRERRQSNRTREQARYAQSFHCSAVPSLSALRRARSYVGRAGLMHRSIYRRVWSFAPEDGAIDAIRTRA